MARVTIEDCLKNVENRFELVMIAAKRARQLLMTSVEPRVPWGNHKATVVALREIEAGHTKFEEFKEEELKKVSFTNYNNASDIDKFIEGE